MLTACNNEKDKTSEAGKNETPAASAPATGTLVFDKLVGTWKREDSEEVFERWTKKDDGTFTSTGFTVNNKDTSWNEFVNIYKEGSNWIFETSVKGQNNGKPVKFTSSSISDNNVVFSNPAHDFPTDISYTVADANTVNAFIVGPNQKGGKDTIPFNYRRAQ